MHKICPFSFPVFCSSSFMWLINFFYLLLLFWTRVLPSRYTTGYLQSFTMSFTVMFAVYVHEEYRQIYFPWASSWSAWKMRLRKFVILTVFVWNCRTKGGGEIWGPSGGLLTIGCILAAGGGPFVRSLLDSCSMERSSCSFCIGMSGSYRGLLRTG